MTNLNLYRLCALRCINDAFLPIATTYSKETYAMWSEATQRAEMTAHESEICQPHANLLHKKHSCKLLNLRRPI